MRLLPHSAAHNPACSRGKGDWQAGIKAASSVTFSSHKNKAIASFGAGQPQVSLSQPLKGHNSSIPGAFGPSPSGGEVRDTEAAVPRGRAWPCGLSPLLLRT